MLTPHDLRTAAIERARAAAVTEGIRASILGEQLARSLPDLTLITLDQAAELRAIWDAS